MMLKRLEILLPSNYNDGRRVEDRKFLITHRELLKKFGATTIDATRASGTWIYGGALYEDVLIRIVIDAFGPDDAIPFLRQYKETLKSRFEQLDIWITAHDVEVI